MFEGPKPLARTIFISAILLREGITTGESGTNLRIDLICTRRENNAVQSGRQILQTDSLEEEGATSKKFDIACSMRIVLPPAYLGLENLLGMVLYK